MNSQCGCGHEHGGHEHGHEHDGHKHDEHKHGHVGHKHDKPKPSKITKLSPSIIQIIKHIQKGNLEEIKKEILTEPRSEDESEGEIHEQFAKRTDFWISTMKTAICFSNNEIIDFLLVQANKMKINIWNKKCDRGWSFAHYAAWSGNYLILHYIYDGKFIPLDMVDNLGNTTLLTAIIYEKIECVKTIINYAIGEKVEEKKKNEEVGAANAEGGSDPAKGATTNYQSLGKIKILEIKNNLGEIPLIIACSKSDPAFFDCIFNVTANDQSELFITYDKGKNLPITVACKKNNLNAVKKLLGIEGMVQLLKVPGISLLLFLASKANFVEIYKYIHSEICAKASPEDYRLYDFAWHRLTAVDNGSNEVIAYIDEMKLIN